MKLELKENQGVPSSLLWTLAIISGVTVANIYYNQPLLNRISRDLNISEFTANLIAMWELHAIPGANKAVTRKGRGIGSGNGKTAGFGSKGQKARSGVKHAGFEGGQMPLARRLPKVGFNNIFATQYAIVNVADLEAAFNAGDVVDTEALKAKGLVKKTLDGVKVLGNGELTKALTVKAAAYSASAKEKIEKAGGKAEVM